MKYFFKARKSILLVASATIVIGFLWGLYFQAPSVVKALFSALMILSVVVFPYGFIQDNDFDKLSNFILRSILALGAVAVLRSVFDDDPDMYVFGNKWLTLFGNEYCALLFIPLLFTYLATNPLNILLIKKINYRYMFLGTFCILFSKYPLAYIFLCLSAFFPYVNRKYRTLILLGILQAILGGLWGERAFFLYIFFAFAAYLLVFVFKKKYLTKLFCLFIVFLPFVLFMPMLSIVNFDDLSFFQKAQKYVIEKTENQDLSTDTRTFLYREMALDLTKSNSWIWGKGAFAHYYSLYFDDGLNGRFGRISSEVPFLNFLMHGGVVYVFFYLLLLLYAVYKGLWKSNNRFVQCIAVVVTGWYFCSFVCDLTGARYYHMLFFILLGCCLSNRFLNMNDDEITVLFYEGENV